MTEVQVIPKRWGSSLGLVIPKEIVESENITEGKPIFVEIRKKHRAKEFFGLIPDWKASPQELKDEARKGWE